MSLPEKCASCEKKLRAGSTKSVVLMMHGGFVRALVCSECFRGAVPMLVPKPVTVGRLCSMCRGAVAAMCLDCADRLGKNVRELAAANAALALTKPEKTNHVQRKGTTLESPRSIVERCDDCGAPAGTTCVEWNTGVTFGHRPIDGSTS